MKNWKFWTWPRQIRALQEINAQQLAACATAAMSDTHETFAKTSLPADSPFWSPAFDDVRRRTSECLRLRAELAQLTEEIKLVRISKSEAWEEAARINAEFNQTYAGKIKRLDDWLARRRLMDPRLKERLLQPFVGIDRNKGWLDALELYAAIHRDEHLDAATPHATEAERNHHLGAAAACEELMEWLNARWREANEEPPGR